jgi:hypothetical protein
LLDFAGNWRATFGHVDQLASIERFSDSDLKPTLTRHGYRLKDITSHASSLAALAPPVAVIAG